LPAPPSPTGCPGNRRCCYRAVCVRTRGVPGEKWKLTPSRGSTIETNRECFRPRWFYRGCTCDPRPPARKCWRFPHLSGAILDIRLINPVGVVWNSTCCANGEYVSNLMVNRVAQTSSGPDAKPSNPVRIRNQQRS
jgi:hypothetical protein